MGECRRDRGKIVVITTRVIARLGSGDLFYFEILFATSSRALVG